MAWGQSVYGFPRLTQAASCVCRTLGRRDKLVWHVVHSWQQPRSERSSRLSFRTFTANSGRNLSKNLAYYRCNEWFSTSLANTRSSNFARSRTFALMFLQYCHHYWSEPAGQVTEIKSSASHTIPGARRGMTP